MKIEKNVKKINPSKREINKFTSIASAMVDATCKALDGSDLVGEQRDSVITITAVDMAAGAKAVKKYYFRKGVVVGMVLVGGVWFYTYTEKKKSEKK